MYTRLKDLYRRTDDFMGKEVTVGGWIRTSRNNGNLCFIELNDGSFFKSVQIVVEGNLSEKGMSFDDAVKLGVGCCITVAG